MFPSILTSNFDLICGGYFWGFLGVKMDYFWGWGNINTNLSSAHIAEQLLFCMFPKILTWNFDTIFDSFMPFWV